MRIEFKSSVFDIEIDISLMNETISTRVELLSEQSTYFHSSHCPKFLEPNNEGKSYFRDFGYEISLTQYMYDNSFEEVRNSLYNCFFGNLLDDDFGNAFDFAEHVASKTTPPKIRITSNFLSSVPFDLIMCGKKLLGQLAIIQHRFKAGHQQIYPNSAHYKQDNHSSFAATPFNYAAFHGLDSVKSEIVHLNSEIKAENLTVFLQRAQETKDTKEILTDIVIKGQGINHFSCHGEIEDNGNSASIRLSSPLPENFEKVVKLADIQNAIMTSSPKSKRLAFLNLCHSMPSTHKNTKNFASVFLLGSYGEVIGCPAEINDHASGILTKSFYSNLISSGFDIDESLFKAKKITSEETGLITPYLFSYYGDGLDVVVAPEINSQGE